MEPSLKNNDKILIVRKYCSRIKTNDIVVANIVNKIIIKRVFKIKDNKYFLVGDNQKNSTDSRGFGLVDKKSIIGKMIFKI